MLENVRLSVVLPAYREAARIGASVSEVRTALDALDGITEIVVVDDGSADGTADAARAAGADQVIVLPENRGKGAAVRAGVLASSGNAVVFTDADLAYPPSQLGRVLEAIEGGSDVVVGNRRHADSVTLAPPRWHRDAGGRVINRLTELVLKGRYRDTQSGLKGFARGAGRAIFERTRIDGFAFDIEVLAITEQLGLRVVELPVAVRNSATSTVHVAVDTARLVRDLARIRRLARSGAYS
jgi:dolichyl-phosphate beta-glucosyltransferase